MLKNKKSIKSIGMALGTVILLVIFNKLTNNAFISQRNLTMLLKQSSVLMILSSTLMILLVEKNIDLSGGAGVYLTSVIVAILIVKFNFNIIGAIIIAIVLGIVMGSANGYFIGFLGLPAFIVTLAAQQIFRGIGYVLTNAATIGPMPKKFTAISEAYISPKVSIIVSIALAVIFIVFNLIQYNKMKSAYGGTGRLIRNIVLAVGTAAVSSWIFGGYKGSPMSVVIAIVVASIMHFITTKTVYGRHAYLIGGNIEAAKLAGVRTDKRVFQSYIMEGFAYGIAGIVLTARLGGAAATGGNLLELDAVAAACIGGTSMSGGSGTIIGLGMGVIILTSIDNVMSLMNVSSYLQMVIKGIILLIAVCFDLYINRSKFKFKILKNK